MRRLARPVALALAGWSETLLDGWAVLVYVVVLAVVADIWEREGAPETPKSGTKRPETAGELPE